MIIENILICGSLFFILAFIAFNLFLNKKTFLLFLLIPLIFLFIWMVYRLIITGHIPFANFYESLMFFGFIYLIKINFLYKWNKKILSIVLIPSALILIIALLIPDVYKAPSPLSPVLQSVWFLVHVPCFFIGYLSLFISFALSIISFFKTIDNYIDNELKTCYFFMCAGLVTGGIWAQISWGVFWSWDAKELYALISIIFLSFSFLFKSNKLKFIVLLLTFISVVFTYFGVTFLLPGLHSYY